ncbi:hypothetical protein Pcinc_022597 [Petrolisthes cinctipes]|uniref:Uncharacterized protein n=1 Tax=Petrolisthes cinctipes TaxID=88211 RepID=A0AAE1FER9_PETCI|nr:hypothetical protein Pcinc_022597 [Petrolisthes cinctipes]
MVVGQHTHLYHLTPSLPTTNSSSFPTFSRHLSQPPTLPPTQPTTSRLPSTHSLIHSSPDLHPQLVYFTTPTHLTTTRLPPPALLTHTSPFLHPPYSPTHHPSSTHSPTHRQHASLPLPTLSHSLNVCLLSFYHPSQL